MHGGEGLREPREEVYSPVVWGTKAFSEKQERTRKGTGCEVLTTTQRLCPPRLAAESWHLKGHGLSLGGEGGGGELVTEQQAALFF